ncbi:MAG: hypothetical protein K2P02_00040, partial [Lachnospiraceae bacterium]|nr:hypothetical protein [Lachnospiraceae bacterium]
LALKETIAYGIPQFFLRYDPRFCPQDHLLTLDYPVLPSLEHLKGVDRIYQYLLSVELEEEFFSCFSCDFVCTILKRSGGEYQNGFSNLALLLLDGLFRNQPFSSDSTSNQLSEALTFYLAKLQERFFPGNDRLFSYLSLAIPDLTAQFRNHIGNQEVSYEGCI